MKAKLTGGQVVAAIFAGIVGHLLFGGGWMLLGLVLFGGVLAGLLGLTAGSIAEAISAGNPAFGSLFDSAGGFVGGVLLGAAVAAVVLMLLGFLLSGWILKGGTVRKPWATTFWSVLIVAVLSLPLLLVYLGISGGQDGGLPFALVALLGTLIIGVLVWLWMTWLHRGPASEFAGVSASATAAPVTTQAPPAVDDDSR